jgi:hypothetical protein
MEIKLAAELAFSDVCWTSIKSSGNIDGDSISLTPGLK